MKTQRLFLSGIVMLCASTLSFGQSIKKDSLSASKEDSVFAKVDKESEFPGGQLSWSNFLNNHLHYPDEAYKNGVQGTVILRFVVGKDGRISDLKAISGDNILREAALKALQYSPRWKPAIQNGKAVRSFKNQPINFRISY